MSNLLTRLIFLYEDSSRKIAAREGEADAPSGILRTPTGKEIRTQFFFSVPLLSIDSMIHHCQLLFDYSEWVIACPRSRYEDLQIILKQFFGDDLRLEAASLAKKENEHWAQHLNDNFQTLTRSEKHLDFEAIAIVSAAEQEQQNIDLYESWTHRIERLKSVSLWMTIIFLVIITFVILIERFNLYAKITGEELHLLYVPSSYQHDHQNSPEYQLGEMLLQLAHERFQWREVESDSVLRQTLAEDSAALAFSRLPDTNIAGSSFLKTKPYLRTRLISVALKRDYQSQVTVDSLKANQIIFGFLGGPQGKSAFEQLTQKKNLKSRFIYGSSINIPRQFEKGFCDILMASKNFWQRANRGDSSWKENFQLISTDVIISSLTQIFSPFGLDYYDYYVFTPSANLRQLIGPVGVLFQDRNQIYQQLNSNWSELIVFQSASECIRALREKEIGVAFLPALLFLNFSQRNPINDLVILSNAGAINKYVIWVNQGRPDLVEKLNNSLEILDYEVSHSGIYRNIFKNEFASDSSIFIEWFPALQ